MAKIRLDIFRRDLKAAEGKFRLGSERIHKQSAKIILRGVIAGTRVDTGKAVSNWRVGLGAPTRSEIEAHAPGSKGSTERANREIARTLGEERINSKRPGQAVYINNMVDYQDYIPGFQSTVDVALSQAADYASNQKVF